MTKPRSVQGLHKSLCKEPRTLELVTSLVSHLHAFARETQLTHAEWTTAVKFLTRVGKESTEYKNEFVLLSDCLGFSALVDEINHPKPPVCPHCHLQHRSVFLTHRFARAARTGANPAPSIRKTHQWSHPAHLSPSPIHKASQWPSSAR